MKLLIYNGQRRGYKPCVMKVQQALASVCSLMFFASATLAAEWHTWTFAQDGEMRTSSGGSVSFKIKGRLEAALFHSDPTNVVLYTTHKEFVTVPITDLSEGDQEYITRASTVEASRSALAGQSDIVRNEMARRAVEAVMLREEAAERRRLAESEAEAAEKLDTQADSLAAKQALVHLTPAKVEAKTVLDSSPAATLKKTKGPASSPTGASTQADDNLAQLRRQAQQKREKADNLKHEAEKLEQIANEETKAAPAHFVHQ